MVARNLWEQVIEALINPSDSEYEEMIEARLTPTHTDALKALLD